MRALLLLLLAAPAHAQEPAPAEALPSAEALLEKMDEQLAYDTRESKVKMIVVNPRRTREFEMHTWGRGLDEAAIEYLAPAREKGTRMLRNADELWMYLPAIERTQKISGHMLRQGMMGSDVSYEDLMNNSTMREDYSATVTGESTVDDRACWTIEMVAKDDSVTYPKRVTCVDKETFIPLTQDLFALSGMQLKSWSMSDVKKDEATGRWVPMTMRIEDKLQQGTYTEIRMDEVRFGVDVPEQVFSMRWLERG